MKRFLELKENFYYYPFWAIPLEWKWPAFTKFMQKSIKEWIVFINRGRFFLLEKFHQWKISLSFSKKDFLWFSKKKMSNFFSNSFLLQKKKINEFSKKNKIFYFQCSSNIFWIGFFFKMKIWYFFKHLLFTEEKHSWERVPENFQEMVPGKSLILQLAIANSRFFFQDIFLIILWIKFSRTISNENLSLLNSFDSPRSFQKNFFVWIKMMSQNI